MADFTAIDQGSIVMLRPNTDEAKAWMDENVHAESWQYSGDFVCIDHRMAQPILDGIEAEGLTGELA